MRRLYAISHGAHGSTFISFVSTVALVVIHVLMGMSVLEGERRGRLCIMPFPEDAVVRAVDVFDAATGVAVAGNRVEMNTGFCRRAMYWSSCRASLRVLGTIQRIKF